MTGKKFKHRLLDLNEEARTGICKHCGPVRIRLRGVPGRHGKGKWRCCRTGVKSRHYSFHTKVKCARCGLVPEHPCQLDVHHIDRNHFNNDPANLMTLCACCHRLDLVGLL